MVTIRAYSNQAEAAMAKSLLDSRDIFCRLADENVNLYGGFSDVGHAPQDQSNRRKRLPQYAVWEIHPVLALHVDQQPIVPLAKSRTRPAKSVLTPAS